MRSKFIKLYGLVDFSSSKNKDAIAITIFKAMNEQIEFNSANSSIDDSKDVATEIASLFNNKELLPLEAFKALFLKISSWFDSGFFDAGRPYFGHFCEALLPERKEALPGKLKALAENTLAALHSREAMVATAELNSSNARLVKTPGESLAELLNPVVKVYEKTPKISEIFNFLLRFAESPENFRQLISPDAVRAWLAAEDHVNRISKVVFLLELRDVSMRREEIWHLLKKGELVPLDVIDDQPFASAYACLLTQIEHYFKQLKAIKEKQRVDLFPLIGSIELVIRMQIELLANLPVRPNLYQLMRSENFFQGLRESINQCAAQTLVFLFFSLKTEGEKKSIIHVVSADYEGSREVLKDYWLCQKSDIFEKFPRVDQDTFLSGLSSRTPGENLRIALQLFPRLKNDAEAQKILEDSRFSWPRVIENHGVFNLVIALMFYREGSLRPQKKVHHFFSENYERHHSLALIEKQIFEFHKSSQQVMQEEDELQATLRLSAQNAFQPQTATHTFDEQRSENGQLLFKLDYWYDIDDMNKIIKCEIDSRGLTNQDQSVLSMSAFSFEDKRFLNYLIAGFKCIMEEQQEKQKPYTVLLPLQIHGNHWVGCVLNIDSENDSVVFRYFDPMPGGHQNSMIATLQGLFAQALGQHYKIQSAPADEHAVWLQPDLCSCGPYVIANFMRYAYSEGLKDPTPSAHAIRKKQVEMISGFREKQFKKLNSALAYQLTAEKEASDLQQRQEKGRQLYEDVSKLSSDFTETFYEFCNTFSVDPVYDNLRVLITRLCHGDFWKIELVLNDTSDAPVAQEEIRKRILSVIKHIFSGITDNISDDDLERKITGDMVEDLPNIFAVASQIEQAKKTSEVSTSLDKKTNGDETVLQQTQEMALVLIFEEQFFQEIAKNPVNAGLKLWRAMVLLAQEIDSFTVTAKEDLVSELADLAGFFRYIPFASYEKIFSSAAVSYTLFTDDGFSSINLLMNVYTYLSDEARKEVVISIVQQQKDFLDCYRDVLCDYWRSTKEIFFTLPPIYGQQIFLSGLKERKPEENLRMALELFSCLTSEEVNSLIKDPRFDWCYIIKNDAVLKITLAAMFLREGDEAGSFAADGVTRALWDSYIQYKKNKIPSLGLGGNTNGLFGSRLSQTVKIEENHLAKGSVLYDSMRKLHKDVQKDVNDAFEIFLNQLKIGGLDTALAYGLLREAMQVSLGLEMALYVDDQEKNAEVRANCLAVMKKVFSDVHDELNDADKIADYLAEGKFVPDLEVKIEMTLKIMKESNNSSAPAP